MLQTAGAIVAAVSDLFLILVVGWQDLWHHEPQGSYHGERCLCLPLTGPFGKGKRAGNEVEARGVAGRACGSNEPQGSYRGGWMGGR